MKKSTFLGLNLVVLFALPAVAFAQANPDLGVFDGFLTEIGGLISAAVPIVVGLAVLLFLWGLARFILNQDNEEARANARQLMIWGIVIIFVMVALWGLVQLLETLTGVSSDEGAATAPELPI